VKLRSTAFLAVCVLLVSSACGQSRKSDVEPETRPTFAVLTSLPLFWGEGGFGEALSGEDPRAPFVQMLSQNAEVRPIDSINGTTLESDETLIIAQPRRLAPEELVAIDRWLRAGGSAVVFADPLLNWPSRYPLGDARRAPPITLLDPLFAHWGLTLDGGSDGRQEERMLGKTLIATMGAGRWTGKACEIEPDGLVARCAIGKGQAILVADADLLNIRQEGQSNVIAVFALMDEAAQHAH
jgi:ABC-type uncharacterized transport system